MAVLFILCPDICNLGKPRIKNGCVLIFFQFKSFSFQRFYCLLQKSVCMRFIFYIIILFYISDPNGIFLLIILFINQAKLNIHMVILPSDKILSCFLYTMRPESNFISAFFLYLLFFILRCLCLLCHTASFAIFTAIFSHLFLLQLSSLFPTAIFSPLFSLTFYDFHLKLFYTPAIFSQLFLFNRQILLYFNFVHP